MLSCYRILSCVLSVLAFTASVQANATIVVTSTEVRVTGTSGADNILIVGNSSSFSITPLNAGEVVTYVGGNNSAVPLRPRLVVNMGAGNDQVQLGSCTAPTININMGEGNNFFNFNRGAVVGNLTVFSGSAGDTMRFTRGSVTGNVLLDTAPGSSSGGDTISTEGTAFSGDVSILTSNLADTVTLMPFFTGSSLVPTTVLGELYTELGNGDDTITANTTQALWVDLFTEGGNDILDFKAFSTTFTAFLTTGAGNDQIRMAIGGLGDQENYFDDILYVDMGSGNDSIAVRDVAVASDTQLFMGTGVNTVTVDDCFFDGRLTVNSLTNGAVLSVEENVNATGIVEVRGALNVNFTGANNVARLGAASANSWMEFYAPATFNSSVAGSKLTVVSQFDPFLSGLTLTNWTRQ